MGEEPDVDRFHPVVLPRVNEDIIRFDEHTVSTWHKIGVLYQTFGQVSYSTGFWVYFSELSVSWATVSTNSAVGPKRVHFYPQISLPN